MKLAIFGGRFDPPHLGHLWVAKQVLDFVPDITEVILMPAFQHQWKETQVSWKQRLEMVSLITNSRITSSDIEMKRKGVSYSIDTIREIRKERNAEVAWIIGSDIVSEFHRWEKSKELFREAEFLVFPRDPYHIPKDVRKEFKILKHPNLVTSNLSSTIVRKRIKEGLSISNFVPDEVEAYINKNSLYK